MNHTPRERHASPKLLKAICQRWDDAALYAVREVGSTEATEIMEEGLVNFLRASAGVSPFQRLWLGVRYCLAAIRDWEEHGPEWEGEE